MPSKDFIIHMLERFYLPISLEKLVLEDLGLTRRDLSRNFDDIYDSVNKWIRKYRRANPSVCQEPYIPPRRPRVKRSRSKRSIRLPPKPKKQREFVGEPIEIKVVEDQPPSLISKYQGPGQIRASEETLFWMIATYGLTCDLSKAAEAGKISITTARKYLRGYGFNLSTRKSA